MAKMPSGLELRKLDREFSASLTSSMDIDKLEGRKENYWFVKSSDNALEVNRGSPYTDEKREANKEAT